MCYIEIATSQYCQEQSCDLNMCAKATQNHINPTPKTRVGIDVVNPRAGSYSRGIYPAVEEELESSHCAICDEIKRSNDASKQPSESNHIQLQMVIATLSELSQHINNIETENSFLRERMFKHEKRVVNLEKRVVNHEKRVVNVEKRVVNVEKRVFNVEKSVVNHAKIHDILRQQIQVFGGSPVWEHVRAHDGRLDDLAKELGDMKAIWCSIQEKFVNEEIQKNGTTSHEAGWENVELAETATVSP